jgi:hemerythrin-like domain-containing protein
MTATIEFRSPEGGFDEPLELWLACHERVLRFCNLLERLRLHVTQHGADAEARQTATSIRRYFNEAAPRHHADEEVDLFPRLLRWLDEGPATASPVDVAQTHAAIDALMAEHRSNEVLWSSLDGALAQIERGTAAQLNAGEIEAFGRTYRRHIEVEEGVVMPAMKRAFSAADWKAVGSAMAQRRGVTT